MITHSGETYQPTSIMRWDRGMFNGSHMHNMIIWLNVYEVVLYLNASWCPFALGFGHWSINLDVFRSVDIHIQTYPFTYPNISKHIHSHIQTYPGFINDDIDRYDMTWYDDVWCQVLYEFSIRTPPWKNEVWPASRRFSERVGEALQAEIWGARNLQGMMGF